MAAITGEKAKYSRNKAFDQKYYLDFICKAIGEHKMMTRKDIDNLLWTKISDVLDEKQKKKKNRQSAFSVKTVRKDSK
jgi:ATP-dependent DNA helicase RecG